MSLVKLCNSYIQMRQSEDEWIGHEHAAGFFVDGGGEDVGVDKEGVVSDSALSQQPHCGVLRTKEIPQVLIKDKNQLGNTLSK